MNKLVYIFLLFTTSGFAQSRFNLITKIDVEASFFTSDNQSNVYVIKGNEITKYDKSGKQLYKYSNKNLGNIDFVDASNMLKIVLFYKNFSQVIFLDNTLTLTAEPISLDKIGFQQTVLICASYNNGMWLYDLQNKGLTQIGQDLDKIQQTGNLSVLLNADLQPDYLVEYNNKVYLNNPATGILIFDIYGTYYKTIPVKQVERFQPLTDWVYYISEKKVKAYNIKTTEEKEFEMPLTEFKNFRLEMNNLILQTENSIYIYSAE